MVVVVVVVVVVYDVRISHVVLMRVSEQQVVGSADGLIVVAEKKLLYHKLVMRLNTVVVSKCGSG